MTPRLFFRPEARAELREAKDWYDARSPGLGSEFEEAVERVLKRVQGMPDAFTALRGDRSYDVPNSLRDPRYDDPTTSGLPPFNPARFLPQRHVMLGLSYRF